ncbi:Target of EGR1 protein 1 [Dirofilaria immitis]|nr:Target of EGR1 protein 1 [Dirofilaria immitis]
MVINENVCKTRQCLADNACCLTSLSRNNFRSRKGYLSNIVVIEVNKENLNITWPYLLVSIRNASFISLDLELSGLGIQKGWLAKSLEERYNIIRQSAQTRSVLSVGIATFQLIKRKETNVKKKLKYKCQVFNILTLCTVPFIVEASGFQFLSKHKFDFNRWITLGIPYNNETEENLSGNTMKTLWREVLCAAVPITLHNGLIDLTFIYQHFYSVLPEAFNEFVKMVLSSAVYKCIYILPIYNETKILLCLSEGSQRENAIEQACNRLYISIEFDFTSAETFLKNAVDIVNCKLPDGFNASASLEPYPIKYCWKGEVVRENKTENYGFCRAKNCSYVHDVDVLLSLEEQKQTKIRERRKRRYDYQSKLSESASTDDHRDRISVSTSTEGRTAIKDSVSADILKQREAKMSVNPTEATDLPHSITGCHRAGVDSFMTGFAVVFMQRMYLLRSGNFDPKCVFVLLQGYRLDILITPVWCMFGISDESGILGNRMALPGKMEPLVIQKSDYIKVADDHLAKWNEIERERSGKHNSEFKL